MADKAQIFEIPIVDEFHFKFSMGGLSRFFIELNENHRFMGARCTKCGYVWCPPRNICSKCLSPTEWIPLKDEGVVTVGVFIHLPLGVDLSHFSSPQVCGLIKLDGADTAFKAIITPKPGETVKPGSRVKAFFIKDRKINTVADFGFELIK